MYSYFWDLFSNKKDAEQNPEKYSFFSRFWNTKEPEVKQTSTITVEPTKITDTEDIAIKDWVNKKYSWYNDAYKSAMYKDAYNAVLQRKGEVEKAQLKERERKEKAELASYQWNDKVKVEQWKLAKAQNAITDAAELIRAGQEMNWARVDKSLTDKETVDKFLLANNWKPYAEYVMKFIQSQMWWWDVNNKWLADKLWINWEDAKKSADRMDKFNAWVQWTAQWLADLWQNTVWRLTNWLASNAGAKVLNAVWKWAELLWADTSEWTVWDRMKNAEWYSWEESKKQASSEWLTKRWVLSEDERAYDIWKDVWHTMAATALTAPAEALVWSSVIASQLPKMWKFTLMTLNWLGWWLWFQAAEDLSKWELSSWKDYLKSWWIWAATAWAWNIVWEALNAWKKLPIKVFWPSWQAENAIIKRTPEEWNAMSNISKTYSKDINAVETPYTKIADELKTAKDTIFENRLSKWAELWDIRNFDIKYADWANYTTKDVLDDINSSLMDLADKSKFWGKAGKAEKIPQFKIWEDWKLEISNLDSLNTFSRNEKGSVVKLWDKIESAFNETFGLWQEMNEATTELFMRKVNWLLKGWWSWGSENMINLVKKWVNNATEKFEKSLTTESLEQLKNARKIDQEAIDLDEAFDKLIWVLDTPNGIKDVQTAAKALKWWPWQEEIFKKILKKTGKDMNSDILSWAYNLSLYDVKKAQDLLNVFYPSKAWVIETFIKTISAPLRRLAANQQIKSGKLTSEMIADTNILNTAFNELGNALYQNSKE